MYYEAGDIIYVRNVVFSDKDGTKQTDLRIKGHPFMVVEDSFTSKGLKLVKLTSRELERVRQHYLSEKTTKPYLRHGTYVNLNKLYIMDMERNIAPVTKLRYSELQLILDKLEEEKDRIITEKMTFQL